jgi:hypothetical protein
MGKFLIMVAVATAGCALLLASSVLVGDLWRSSRVTEERAIRALISEWVEAYQNLDAKRLAAHETHAVANPPKGPILERNGGSAIRPTFYRLRM